MVSYYCLVKPVSCRKNKSCHFIVFTEVKKSFHLSWLAEKETNSKSILLFRAVGNSVNRLLEKSTLFKYFNWPIDADNTDSAALLILSSLSLGNC